MNARIAKVDWTRDGPAVVELDGPCAAFFEIPLDYFATPNGELEAENHPEASRLLQRVVYQNFYVADNARVQNIIERVTNRLKELGGGYIWWRMRPRYTQERTMRLRLGTTPELPASWWERLSQDVSNRTEGQG